MSLHAHHADIPSVSPSRLSRLAVANVMILASVVVLLVGYLVLCTAAADKGFQVRELDKRVADLNARQERQNLEVLGMQAMDNIDKKIGGLGMVPVQDIQYLNVGGTVAVR